MKKRLTCLLLVLAMVLAMVPAALAEEESQLLASSLTDYDTETSEQKIAVSLFQDVYESNMTEAKSLLSLISDVTFSLEDECQFLSLGEVVRPQETVTNTEDSYWWVPMTFAPGNENSALCAAVTLTTGEVLEIRVECHTSVRDESNIDCSDPNTFPSTYAGENADETPEIDTMAELNELIQGLHLSKSESAWTAVTLEENLSAYPDAGAVSECAITAMNWAVGQGLINGLDGKLAPQATATRAQTAAILTRYCKKD